MDEDSDNNDEDEEEEKDINGQQHQIVKNDNNGDDDKEDSEIEIDNFMKDINIRNRIQVRVKKRRLIHDIRDMLCNKKSSHSSEDTNSDSDNELPPKRYIYWGPQYDIRDNNNIRTSRAPNLENEDINDGNDNLYQFGSEFVSNYVSTTKYTPLTFLPLNLFEQFRKKANSYFLIIAILASTPISPKNAFFSWAPLCFVLAVSAIKEAYEDYKRYEMDKEVNNRLVDAFRPDLNGKDWQFRKIAWMDIQIGDMVRITADSKAFPADLLLLQSSTNQGLCNIETANLDGETNLKIKQAIGATYSLPTDRDGEDYLLNNKLQFKLESEAPNENISKWNGAVYFYGCHESISIGINQLILRGCNLRNTDWIIGCVIFTGIETKISLNNKKTKFKRSNVDKTVDKALYFIFIIQQILCIFAAMAHGIWLNLNATNEWYQYINADGSSESNWAEQSILNYFTFLVLLDILVPISLYVSMELVKLTQAYLINFDATMVEIIEDETGQGNNERIAAKARTSNLNEELGQIRYIFSDKTGTLTENKMAFIRCHVDGVRYGPDEMERQNDSTARISTPDGMPIFDKKCLFTDNRLAKRCSINNKINEFLTLLSVCHSIIPQYGPLGENGPIIYNASSPDEKALVLFAKNMHYYFYRGHVNILEMNGINQLIDGHRFYVNIHSNKYKFDIYNMLEFTSKRKRMSVIVCDPRDNKLKLYCKGADNVIYQRLNSNYKPNGNDVDIAEWEKTLESLQVFAADGLRTLVCGYKEIDSDYYCLWLNKLNKAKSSMKNRDILVEECYNEIENNLILLGATAIEDKLQDGVPDTIANLAVAGISIWVLTGDKVETAINIGRSCRLLTHTMTQEKNTLFVMDPDEKKSEKQTINYVDKKFKEAWNHLGGDDHIDNDPNQGFVISGKALSVVFPARKHDKKGKEIPPTDKEKEIETEYQETLLKILLKCRAIVCCRVSPIQKAQIVSLVKQNVLNVITLAIGDGANDVPMIKAAHVGIGISGQEGLQAVMSSDYAIGQFRFLQDLLLIHGAWNYRRISVLILYSFYKNVMLSMTQIWFAFYSGFSGTLFYDQMAGSTYNLVYTAFPVMFAAVFDRPYTKEICKLCPELYANGPRNASFNLRIFGVWFSEGLIHAIIIFWTAIMFMDSSSIGKSGQLVGFWVSNTTMFTAAVTVATSKIMFETKTWTAWSVVFYFLSYLSWFLFILIWSAIPIEWGLPNEYMFNVAQITFSLPQFWFVILLDVVLSMYPTVLWKFMKKMYNPTRYDMIQEIEMKPQCCFYKKMPINRNIFIKSMKDYLKSLQKPKMISFIISSKKLKPGPDGGITDTIVDDDDDAGGGGGGVGGQTTYTIDDEKLDYGEEDEDKPFNQQLSKKKPRLIRTKTDLGYTEFQVGRDHSGFIITQHAYLNAALSEKQFSRRTTMSASKSHVFKTSKRKVKMTYDKLNDNDDNDKAMEPLALDDDVDDINLNDIGRTSSGTKSKRLKNPKKRKNSKEKNKMYNRISNVDDENDEDDEDKIHKL